MNDHAKRVALITGASRGVGKALAIHLARNDIRVAVGYARNKANADDVVAEINRNSEQYAIAVQVDYADLCSIDKAIALTQTHFESPISILVNNGAIAQEKDFLKISEQDFKQMIDINLSGPFFACQKVIPDMLKRKHGTIINISSIGGQWGGVNQVHYAAAKAGLINLTRSLAKLYSAKGISSHCIAIGLVETEMSQNELQTSAGKRKIANIPSGRISTKEELAATVSFLISDHAEYLSGQTLNMNGGMLFN